MAPCLSLPRTVVLSLGPLISRPRSISLRPPPPAQWASSATPPQTELSLCSLLSAPTSLTPSLYPVTQPDVLTSPSPQHPNV